MDNVKILDIKTFVFGTPDRILSFVSVVVGMASLLLTVALWTFPEKVPELIITRDLLVVILLLLVSGVLFYKYIRREVYLRDVTNRLAYSKKRLYKQFNNFHLMTHKFRSRLFACYLREIPQDLVVSADEKKVFEGICHSLTSDIKKIFLDFFDAKGFSDVGNICVTIKLTLSAENILEFYGNAFNAEQKRLLEESCQWVITAYRDPDTYEALRDQREVGCKIYNINRNTAFIHVLKEKKQIYACDDLDLLGDSYLNENDSWKGQYNATIVAPVRYSEGNNSYRCFGMIAVDCMNPDKNNLFVNDQATDIIGQAADLLANYFLVISLCKLQPNTANVIN